MTNNYKALSYLAINVASLFMFLNDFYHCLFSKNIQRYKQYICMYVLTYIYCIYVYIYSYSQLCMHEILIFRHTTLCLCVCYMFDVFIMLCMSELLMMNV